MGRRKNEYTEEMIDYLREITPGRSNKEITKMFNKKFNLNKTENAIRAVRIRNGIKTGLDGRFKKGQTPWNKGLKGYMGPNKTSFKKGEVPANYRPIGSERVSMDGYTEVKIKDPNVWELKHRLIWEKHHGPIPDGHVVIFGDGDKTNFDIDNLILVSREQLLQLNRHGLIKNDTELTKMGVAIAEIYCKINERKREG